MIWFALISAVLGTAPDPAMGIYKEPVTVEGSSTISPYVRALSTLIRDESRLNVIQDGTSSGIASLCSGLEGAPQIASASRKINPRELERCHESGISRLYEKFIGYDGIVIAQTKSAPEMELSAKDIYYALSHQHPRSDTDCVLVRNTTVSWEEVREDLPDREIKVIGPPRSSGTWDVFVKKALESGARSVSCLATLEKTNPVFFEKATQLRQDNHWIDGGEHDEAIAKTLHYVHDAVGIFGYAYLLGNDKIEAIKLDGVGPTAETILDGSYQLSRRLYLYTTPESYQENDGVQDVVRAFGSFAAVGPGGILTSLGLVTDQHGDPMIQIDTATGEMEPVVSHDGRSVTKHDSSSH